MRTIKRIGVGIASGLVLCALVGAVVGVFAFEWWLAHRLPPPFGDIAFLVMALCSVTGWIAWAVGSDDPNKPLITWVSHTVETTRERP